MLVAAVGFIAAVHACDELTSFGSKGLPPLYKHGKSATNKRFCFDITDCKGALTAESEAYQSGRSSIANTDLTLKGDATTIRLTGESAVRYKFTGDLRVILDAEADKEFNMSLRLSCGSSIVISYPTDLPATTSSPATALPATPFPRTLLPSPPPDVPDGVSFVVNATLPFGSASKSPADPTGPAATDAGQPAAADPDEPPLAQQQQPELAAPSRAAGSSSQAAILGAMFGGAAAVAIGGLAAAYFTSAPAHQELGDDSASVPPGELFHNAAPWCPPHAANEHVTSVVAT